MDQHMKAQVQFFERERRELTRVVQTRTAADSEKEEV